MKLEQHLIYAIAIALLSTNLTACAAKGTPQDWKTDCVGRMQISLPSEVEVATISAKDRKDNPSYPEASFADNQKVFMSASAIHYLQNFEISPTLSDAELEKALQNERENKAYFASSAEVLEGKKAFYDFSVLPQQGVAFGYGDQRFFSMQIGKHMIEFKTITHPKEDVSSLPPKAKKLINALSAREPFELPKKNGVCIPYAFIQDDNDEWRGITTAYRLKSHPDITVWLEDKTASDDDTATKEGASAKKQQDLAYLSDDFWSQYKAGYRVPVYTVWDAPQYRPVTLAGQNGLSSFTEINRPIKRLKDQYRMLDKPVPTTNPNLIDAYNEDVIYYEKIQKLIEEDEAAIKKAKHYQDYGYFAAVLGNTKTNTPDLRFYVIQQASNATAKGIEPLSKEAFLELAQTIAASIKPREIQIPQK